MPEFGGKKLATNFKFMIEQTLAKAAADAGAIVQEAANELADDMRRSAKGAARAIRVEGQAMKEAFDPYIGNNDPDETPEPPVVQPEEPPAQPDTTDGKPNPIP